MKLLKKILIIDDDETRCFLDKIFLEDMHVTEEIECFEDPEEALAFIKKICSSDSFANLVPDLIFLDINMPVLNGFDFLEKVKQMEGIGNICAQRIVMYTSSVHPRDIKRANSYGVLGYIQKPLNEEKLKTVLEAYDQAS